MWHACHATTHDRDSAAVRRSGFTSALLSGYLAVFYFRLLDKIVRLPNSLASIGGPLGGLCSLLPVLTKVRATHARLVHRPASPTGLPRVRTRRYYRQMAFEPS
eukprot:2032183-Pleurochrysis_carterae.AAC.4